MKTNNENRYSGQDLLEMIDSPEIDLEEELDNDLVAESNEKRRLYVDKVDKSTSDLFRMIQEGELNLQPDYQRKFVWDKKTMSKFIESLLLSIPIPTIFLSENADDTYEVIDGQQRLTTIFAFMKSKLEEADEEKLPHELKSVEVLSLTGLETLREYNKKSYVDLEGNIQRKFNNVSLPMVIIKKDSTEDIKYDIFSRINSGSVKLNNQELLNVMYRGVLISNLNDVSNSEQVDNLFGNRPVLKKRFGYNEILLRAKVMETFIDEKTWTIREVKVKNRNLLDKEYKKYNGRLKNAILDYLKEFRNDELEAYNLKQFVEESIEKVRVVFADSAFIRINKKGSTSINKTIAELQLVVLSKFDLSTVKKYKDKIKESFDEFLEETEENIFIRATNNTSNVEKRYQWGKKLSEILSEDK